jgi:hypothetical protein
MRFPTICTSARIAMAVAVGALVASLGFQSSVMAAPGDGGSSTFEVAAAGHAGNWPWGGSIESGAPTPVEPGSNWPWG